MSERAGQPVRLLTDAAAPRRYAHDVSPEQINILRLLMYLDTCPLVAVASSRTLDQLDPARGLTVPLGTRTNGQYLFELSAAYYLEHHGLLPHPELIAAAQAAQYEPPRLTATQIEDIVDQFIDPPRSHDEPA